MTLQAVDQGLIKYLNTIHQNAGLELDTYKVRLYINNHTPVKTDVLANFTECTAAGYITYQIPLSSWTISTVGGHDYATSNVTASFNITAAVTVYGYYLTDGGPTVCMYAEYIPGGPISFGSAGGTIEIIPQYELTSP